MVYSVKDHIGAIHRQTGQPFIDYVILVHKLSMLKFEKYEKNILNQLEVKNFELEKESINVKRLLI